jgi:hypothetical protein
MFGFLLEHDHITDFFLLCKGKCAYCYDFLQPTEIVRLTVFGQQYFGGPNLEATLRDFRSDGSFMRHDNAADRVRRRIAEWVKQEGHGSRKRLADAVPSLHGDTRSQSWVTDIIDGPDKGGQDLRLRDLDAVADAMDVFPGELVRRHDRIVVEVTPTEYRMIRFFRAMPEFTRHHLVQYFDYIFGLQEKVLGAQAEERDRRTEETKRKHASHPRKRIG